MSTKNQTRIKWFFLGAITCFIVFKLYKKFTYENKDFTPKTIQIKSH